MSPTQGIKTTRIQCKTYLNRNYAKEEFKDAIIWNECEANEKKEAYQF